MVYADVIVGKRGSSEELTYAVPAKIIPYIGVGSLVVVPVRDKKIKAIVVSLHKYVDSELKSKVREILSIDRKIPRILNSRMEVVKSLAKKYLTNTSDIVFRALSSLRSLKNNGNNLAGEVSYLQAVWTDRIKYYKKVVGKYHETLIIFPTNHHLIDFKKNIPKEFSHDLVVLTRGRTLKTTEKLRNILFLGTVGSSFLPIKVGGLIIIDQPSHIGSRYSNRPYLKSEDIALARSKYEDVDVLISQSIVSPNHLLKIKNKEADLISINPKKTKIIISSRVGSRGIFLPNVISQLLETVKEGSKVCLFVASKGWASGYFCRNCQELVKCSRCGRTTGVSPKNLSCNYCGQVDNLPGTCSNCGKEDYISLGEGVDKVAKEAKNVLGVSNYQVIAGKRAQYSPITKLTIATEKILSFPSARFDIMVIVSADQALTRGATDDQWKFLLILKEMAAMCNVMTIQTHLLENRVWGSIVNSGVKKYFEEELNERKNFGLPPYASQLNLVGTSKGKKVLEKQVLVIVSELESHTKVEFSVSEYFREHKAQLVVRIQIIFPYSKGFLRNKISKVLPPNWAVLPV